MIRITDNDVKNLIENGTLNFKRIVEKYAIESNSEDNYSLSEIKSAKTFIVGRLYLPALSIELSCCDFQKIQIKDATKLHRIYINDRSCESNTEFTFCVNNSDINKVVIEESGLSKIKLDNYSIVASLRIRRNQNLKEASIGHSFVRSLIFSSQNNLTNFNIIGGRVEKLYLSSINIQLEKPHVWLSTTIYNVTILKCNLNVDLNLSSDYLEEVDIENKCTFKSLKINHKNANIKIDNCTIDEKLTIGSESTEVNSSKFEIINNTFVKGVFFGKHHIKNKFKIEGNRLENGRWDFYGFSLDENCKSEITKQSFKDVTFQNCDFSNFDFQDTDIHLAEIIEPKWNEVDDFTCLGRCSKKDNLSKLQRTICWLLRFFNLSNLDNQKRISFERDSEFYKEKDIEKLKKQYSYFRKKFESQNSYEISSKFKISEALTRIKLLKAKKSSRRHLLKISKCLNLFSESIFRPAIWFALVLVSFTILYLFAGFEIKNGDSTVVCVDYSVKNFDINKIISRDFSDFENYWHAFVFSLKNIVPIKLESNFYLSADSGFRWTQLLSMFQKLMNIIILGALIASMRNFFRK